MFTAPVMLLGNRESKKYSDPQAWHNQFYNNDQDRQGCIQAAVPRRKKERSSQRLNPCARKHVDFHRGERQGGSSPTYVDILQNSRDDSFRVY